MLRVMKRLLANWQTLVGMGIVAGFLAVALAAPLLAPPDDPSDPAPYQVVGRKSDRIPKPPSLRAPLGTETGQIDVYYSLVWGTRSALRFGLTVTVCTAAIGIAVGALGGIAGRRMNDFLMRATDAFLMFPIIAGLWLFNSLLAGPLPEGNITPFQRLLLVVNPVVIVFVLFSWMSYARLVNANMLRIRESEFVEAARVLGAGQGRILTRHLLPNALTPVIVLMARDVGAFLVLETAFAFIGLTNVTEWGMLLRLSRDWVIGAGGNPLRYWWTYLPVSLALILFALGWNLLGDGLNDAMNPRRPARLR